MATGQRHPSGPAPAAGGGADAPPHRFHCRVYYEDTDLAGIVYYANYLKYLERARSEWVRGLGVDQRRLHAEAGIVFAVRRVVAEYLAPARFDDLLTVETAPVVASAARLVLAQRVFCGERLLLDAEVTLVALDARGRPVRLPAALAAGRG
jgi:acyl-CoA thioester hydrolase